MVFLDLRANRPAESWRCAGRLAGTFRPTQRGTDGPSWAGATAKIVLASFSLTMLGARAGLRSSHTGRVGWVP